MLKNSKAVAPKVLLGRLGSSVKCPTLTQVMISQFVGLSPTSGSADSSDPGACLRFCISISLAPPPLALCLSKINVEKNICK